MQYLDKVYNSPASLDPLPRIGFFTYQHSSGSYGIDVFNSNLTKHSSYTISTSSEAVNNWGGGYLSTASYISSNSGSYMSGQTTANYFGGNCYIRPASSSGPMASSLNWGVGSGQSLRTYFGCSYGEYGVGSRTSLYFQGSTIRLFPRYGLSYIESVSLTSVTHWTSVGAPGTDGRGQVSYNDRTRTLLVVVGSSNSYRAHVWRNPNISLSDKNALKSGILNKFITDAKSGVGGASYYYNDFSWSTSSSSSYAESQYHNQYVLGDNGKVGIFRMTPSTQATWGKMTLNPSGTTTTVTTINSVSLTTSYGIDQGAQYGSSQVVSWDQNWAATFCQYYYYGAGYIVVYWYTPDPEIYFYDYQQDTTYGFSIVPIGRSSFTCAYQQNADNGGPYVNITSPEPARAGFTATGSAIANGGQLTAGVGGVRGESFSTTTNYPVIIQVPNDTAFNSNPWGI